MSVETLKFQQFLDPSMVRGRGNSDKLDMFGKFNAQLLDRFGNPLTEKLIVPNGITIPAKTSLFDIMFNGVSAKTNWYVGLIDGTGYTGVNSADTMASHTGWSEFAGYSFGATDTTHRQPWGQGSAANAIITNGTQLTFVFTAAGSVTGIFVCSAQTKATGDSSDILWSTALFTAPLAVAIDDQLKITYTVTA